MRIEPRRQLLEGWRELVRAELSETSVDLPEFPDFAIGGECLREKSALISDRLADAASCTITLVVCTDETPFAEEFRPVDLLVPVVAGEPCRARHLHDVSVSPGGELSPTVLRRVVLGRWQSRHHRPALIRPERVEWGRTSLLAAAVTGRGVGYRGPVRETLVLLLRLICAALDLLFRGPPGVLLVDGARHCPGRRLAARPRVPRGPAAPGRLRPSSRGDVALAA